MQNVADTSFRELRIFIDISDYKEKMSIGPQKYCFAMGIVVRHMVNQRIIYSMVHIYDYFCDITVRNM